MQNFRPGYVQGRRKKASDKTDGRPCRAEVRWYDATEDGLFDARPTPQLWATRSEMERWSELRRENESPSDTAISILVQVLKENIPERLRTEIKSIKK